MGSRKNDYIRLLARKKRKRKRLALTVVLIVLAVMLLSALAFAAYAAKVINDSAVKDLDTDNLYSLIYQKTTLYDSQGKEIDALYLSGGNRTITKYEQLPKSLVDAVVDTEDKTFWKHHGFNYVRMMGAVKERIFGGEQISGTSTITQQLARNIYLSDTKSERTLQRKILEAYYTVILERELSKEQILEAYFNAVYFGFNSYGINAAANSYFSKQPQELELTESAALAALPQAPDTYALVKTAYASGDLPVLEKGDGLLYLYNGKASEERRNLILSNMKEEGDITDAEYEEAMSASLEERMKIDTGEQAGEGRYSYFIDCAVDEAAKDIAESCGVSEEEGRLMVYSKGYNIYTSLDTHVQDILHDEINTDSNYAAIRYINKDGDGNIVSSSGKVIMRPYGSFFDDDGSFILTEDEYSEGKDGQITLFKNNRLDFYEAEAGGKKYACADFKGMYQQDGGALYFLEGGSLLIPAGYTKLDADGNCVVSSAFRKDFPDFFKKEGEGLKITSDAYRLGQKMRQPQAAAVVIDNSTGCVVAMTGGRGAKGRQLFNRATSPRQPGSSIKPIAVYGPALQQSAEAAREGETLYLTEEKGDNWGSYITAGSIINDAPLYLNGKIWPRNAYSGFQGKMSLRKAVQQSVNVCAVKVFRQIGADYSVEMLKKNGISTVVEEGETSDMNDALALGGMTNGISPLELTAAYETFANGGTYREPMFYTKITNSQGELILDNANKTERVYDESVAWIMTDILKSAVQKGTGQRAKVAGHEVAGKTGTTSQQYDVWFSGYTPSYSMALWMGNDANISLASYSEAAAGFWSAIMSRICEDLPSEVFPSMPSGVVKYRGEYYAEGTERGAVKVTETTTTQEQTQTEDSDDDDDFDSYFTENKTNNNTVNGITPGEDFDSYFED